MLKYCLYALIFTLSIQNSRADIFLEFAVIPSEYNPLVDQFSALPQRLIYFVREEVVVTQPVYASSSYTLRTAYDLNEGEAWSIIMTKNFKDRVKEPWMKSEVTVKDTSSVVIRGYPSQQAEIKTEEGTVEVFYTNYFGVNFFPYGDIKGIPLRYSVESKYFGRVCYELINLETRPLPNNIFDYESVQEFAGNTKTDQKKTFEFNDEFKITEMNLNHEVIPNPSDNTKLYVLNFWFIGCQPCIRELPMLNSLAEKYLENKKVRFIAIARDKASQLKKFLKKNPFNYEQIPFGVKLVNKLDIKAYPTNIIMDNSGKVLFYEQGYAGTTAFDMDQIIQDALIK